MSEFCGGKCLYCGDDVGSDGILRGKQGAHNTCFVLYKTNVKSLKDSKRKGWWNEKSAEEKQAWYRKQKGIKDAGQRSKFDDHEVEEQHTVDAVSSEKYIWDHLPWKEYLKEQYLLKIDYNAALQNWNKDLMDDDIPKRYLVGLTMVGVFRGLRGAHGSEEKNGTTSTRKRQVGSSENIEDLMSAALKKAKQDAEAMGASAGTIEEDLDDNMVSQQMVSDAVEIVRCKGVSEEIARDLAAKKKSEALQMAADLEDYCAIEEHAKARREADPKSKSFAELKASAVNMATARELRISNHMLLLKKSAEEATAVCEKKAQTAKEDVSKKQWLSHIEDLNQVYNGTALALEELTKATSMEKVKGLANVEDLDAFKNKSKELEEIFMNGKKGGKFGAAKGLIRTINKAVESLEKNELQKGVSLDGRVGDNTKKEVPAAIIALTKKTSTTASVNVMADLDAFKSDGKV